MLPPCHFDFATVNGEPATASAVITQQQFTVRKVGSFDPFWFPQFPYHWTISLAKQVTMMFTDILANPITVWNVKQAVGLPCI